MELRSEELQQGRADDHADEEPPLAKRSPKALVPHDWTDAALVSCRLRCDGLCRSRHYVIETPTHTLHLCFDWARETPVNCRFRDHDNHGAL